MEFERNHSSGVAKGGLTTGIIGTALGALNSLALMNNGYNTYNSQPRSYYNDGAVCSEDHFVNRYEAQLQHTISEKDSQLMLKDAITSQDGKMLEMYKYVDGRLREVEANLARQAVVNQKTEDSFALAQKDLDCCCRRLETAISSEKRERECEDKAIITYSNATFYPKMVADVTTGSTTTPQRTYSPLTRTCCCQ